LLGDRLLARAIDGIRPVRDAGVVRLSFQVWDDEADLLAGQEGMRYVSTTLLIANEPVHTYKGCGFLVNGDTARIVHVSELDSNSAGGDTDFRAAATNLANLDELAQAVRGAPADMNEVNAHFGSRDVLGLFAVDARSPTNKVDAYLIQSHLRDRGWDLPVFVYDPRLGSLTEWAPTIDEVAAMIPLAHRGPLANFYNELLVPDAGAERGASRAPSFEP